MTTTELPEQKATQFSGNRNWNKLQKYVKNKKLITFFAKHDPCVGVWPIIYALPKIVDLQMQIQVLQ